MAQLKSTVVQGSLRVTDTTYTTDLVVSDVTTPTIANNDYLLVADASDGNKLLKGPIFDGSTTTQALTKKGTWATFNNYSHPTGDGNLHVPATGTGNNGKVLKAGSTAGSLSWGTLGASDVGLGSVSNNANLNSTTGTKGDMVYWSAASTPARLAIGTAGYTLQATANGPVWTQTVAVANGGTGATQFTANSLIMSGSTTTAALTTRAIVDRTSVNALTALATWAANTGIPTVNLIAHWDGRYQTTNNASNLAYCNKGAFGNAVTYGVDDATANGALGTGTGLTTERSVYYGLVTVNNASQTRATGIYAPTSAGTANQILVSAGGTSAPTWKATANGAAYATGANGELTFGTLPIAQGGTGITSTDAHKVLIGPSSGNAAAPTWRTLVAADLPTTATDALGIMKVGTGLGVSSGTVSVSYGTSVNTALQGDAYLVKLNGLTKTAASIADFYAPTSVGTNGQFLKSIGSGEPTWSALPTASTTVAGIVKLGASGGAATYEHTHAANAVVQPASFTSVTLNNDPGYTYSNNWITADTVIIATDLQTLSLPGIVTWTISAGKIVFKCTVQASLSFSIMMLKQA